MAGKLGRWVAKLGRWVAKLGRWVAKFQGDVWLSWKCACLLRQLSWSGSSLGHLSKVQNGRLEQRSGQNTLARQKNIQKKILKRSFANTVPLIRMLWKLLLLSYVPYLGPDPTASEQRYAACDTAASRAWGDSFGSNNYSIMTPNPECRRYWCLIEFIDWRYSQSVMAFSTALGN